MSLSFDFGVETAATDVHVRVLSMLCGSFRTRIEKLAYSEAEGVGGRERGGFLFSLFAVGFQICVQ